MASADIALNANVATVECDDTVHRITLDGANCNLVNVGAQSIFLSMINDGALHRDGLQHDGEIQLDPNDSVPFPAEASFVRHQCAAGQVSKLWYVPRSG